MKRQGCFGVKDALDRGGGLVALAWIARFLFFCIAMQEVGRHANNI